MPNQSSRLCELQFMLDQASAAPLRESADQEACRPLSFYLQLGSQPPSQTPVPLTHAWSH